MAVQFVWRHPRRRDVELALLVTLRMVHVGGWRRLVVAITPQDVCYVGVELAAEASEDDAYTWSRTFAGRYRVAETIEGLLSSPARFGELYIGGGVGALLNRVEWEETKRRATWIDIRDDRGVRRQGRKGRRG